MTLLLTLLGIALNVLVLQDIFRTLFVPTGAGALSSFAARRLWHIFRQAERHRPKALALAGPFMLLCIIALWALGLAVGWAMIIWPHLPAGFHFSSGMDPAAHSGFGEALYFSLVTLATLGYGDIVPANAWLRVIIPIEALVGFSLGTASVSWILSITPVLARRRHLAREVYLLGRIEQRGGPGFADTDPQAMGAILRSLTEQVISVRNDFAQVPIIYYFHTPDRGSALEVALLDLQALMDTSLKHPAADIQMYGAMLEEALMDLAAHIAESFLDRDPGSLRETLRAYAEDHAHPIDRQTREAEVKGELHAEN
jgi:voltage-gated potassium channel Kch